MQDIDDETNVARNALSSIFFLHKNLRINIEIIISLYWARFVIGMGNNVFFTLRRILSQEILEEK